MEFDKQLRFKSHKSMHVKFIFNNVDVTTQDHLSNVALVYYSTLHSVNQVRFVFCLTSVV